jgi:iron(III) transport system permease protein
LKLLPFIHGSVFNIYSFWGIVWAHFAGGTLAIQVMLLTTGFRNLDASLEEASNVSGSSPFGTLRRVVVPIMTPVLTVVLLLSTIYGLNSFEVETVLGFPIRFFVFSTQIYFSIQQQPPLYAAAMALSTIVLAALVPLIFVQRWAAGRRRFTTVTSHFRVQKLRLRRWRRPVFGLVLLFGLMITVVPFTFLMLATFMKLLGFFNLPEPWTLDHWNQVLRDPIFVRSVLNTLLLGGGTVVGGVSLSLLIAYIVMRTKFVGRAVLDFASWLPITFPGIILSLGLLWLFLGTPILRGLYGTIFLLIVATVVSSMTTTVQLLKSNLAQLGVEMEEAARVEGGSWLQAMRHVLVPIVMPTLLLVGALSFISAARNVATVALLATSSTRPLSLLQLDMMVQGTYESAAVVGVVVVVLTTGTALVARVLGLRLAIEQ